MTLKYSFFEEYLVGHDQIDDDHIKLFAVMNGISQTIDEGDTALCQTLFTSFYKLAEEHFHNEELILKDQNYPDLERHIKYHQKLLTDAKETAQKCQNLENNTKAKQYFEELASFFIHDVVKGDQSFKKFIKQ